MRAVISIKVDTPENEERIMSYVKEFVKDNFNLPQISKAEICVTGKNETLYDKFEETKEIKKEILNNQVIKREKDFYSILSQLINNLEDDLELDLGVGESGAKTYEDSYKAVKRYTLRLLRRLTKKQKKRLDALSGGKE